jgi:D-alanine-D-alanine ligase
MGDKLPAAPARAVDHVAVLMGGWSSERPISLKSGSAVAEALEAQGYRVSRVDVDRNVSATLSELKPDVCFNALHGPIGEDGAIQGLLECLGLAYTHSDVSASALAMHKTHAKTVMQASGVPVADAVEVTRQTAATSHAIAAPYVVKPISDGSSFGVVIVTDDSVPPPSAIAAAGAADEIVMVERYIPGRELTCAVIGDFVTDVIEICPAGEHEFYDFDAKYAPGGSKHVLPAQLLPEIYQMVRKYTLAAHRALGCRGVSRADFRFDETVPVLDGLICLEVNTQPGMTETSLVPELAAYAGWSFSDLVRWIVEDARCDRSKDMAT